jgi:hypothetical protein
MPCHIAGIDVHEKMLAVAVADVEVEGDYHSQRLKSGPAVFNCARLLIGSSSATSRKW